MIQSGFVEIWREQDAVFDVDREVVDLELLINVLVLFPFKTTTVEGCEVPVAVSGSKVNFLDTETDRDWNLVKTVLVPDMDVLNINLHALKEAEDCVESQGRSELCRLGQALSLALTVQNRASAVGRSARRGLRLGWGFSFLVCLPAFVLLDQIMHLDHVGQWIIEVVMG